MLDRTREKFDVAIIGGGVAGISAALWCDDLGLSAVLLEEKSELGGQLLWVHNEIKNYLGREARNGRELRDAFVEQSAKRRFELLLSAPVAAVDLQKREILTADGARISARALVIATGVRRRRLQVAGETEFAGRGIIESGKKDAARVAGKRVLIAGGGDAAFENALILAETSAQVTLVHRGKNFRAREEFTEKAKNQPKIDILTETAVEKIGGSDERVESVGLINLANGEKRSLAVDAVLIRIGVEPNTELLRGKLKLDRDGYIEVDRDGATTAPGVYAAGDVANPVAPTINSAAGTGATVVKAIFSLLSL
jgi:thioredoxin reductase (NADPH)